MSNNENKMTLIELIDTYWRQQVQINDKRHKANEEYRLFAKRQKTTGNDMALRSAFRRDYIKRNAQDPAYIDFLVKRRSFYQKMAKKCRMWLESVAKYGFTRVNEDREKTIERFEMYYDKARRAAAEYDMDILNVEAQRMKLAKSDDPRAFII